MIFTANLTLIYGLRLLPEGEVTEIHDAALKLAAVPVKIRPSSTAQIVFIFIFVWVAFELMGYPLITSVATFL